MCSQSLRSSGSWWIRPSSRHRPTRFSNVTARANPGDILSSLIAAAKRSGADAADALLVESTSSSVSYRMGRLEDVERSESADLGLRVFVGNKVAFVSSTDLSKEALQGLPERA